MGIETVSLIIAAFVNGAIAIAALLRNFRSRACTSFACLAGLLFLHDTLSVFESFRGAALPVVRIHTWLAALIGLAALWALRGILPRDHRGLARRSWFYLPILVSLLGVMTLAGYPRWSTPILILAHVGNLWPAWLWIRGLARAQGETVLTRERLRFRYAFAGALLTLAFYLTDALRFAGYAVPPLGTLARTLYLIFIFQTFVQKELMTDEELVAKVSLFGGVAVTLSGIYLLLVSWVGNQRDLFYFNTLIASFVILILFDPIRKLTSRLTRRLFLRRNLLLESELAALSSELMGVIEPGELAQRISSALRRSLSVQSSSLFLIARDSLSYIRVGRAEGAAPEEISSSVPLIEYMNLRRGRPFVVETVENDRDSFHSALSRRFFNGCLEELTRVGADFILPFQQEGRLVGFCAVKTGERVVLSNEQLRIFIPVARQIALCLKNGQTFATLRDRDKLAAIGEMAAGLAHEIKNPLGAINGAAQLLKESGEGSVAHREFLGIILDETRRLSGVVSDFLDYAKPRRNQPQTSCDPYRVIEHTAAMVLRDARVSWEIKTENEGLTLEADPEILKQCLLNLFLNAIQAMEKTERPFLRVSLRELRPRKLFSSSDALPWQKILEGWDVLKGAPSAPYVEIEVSDNGKGIAESDLPRIFEPFYTTKARGTGLGLAITRRLVEEMGGTIGVRSRSGAGSTFTLHLPVRRESGPLPTASLDAVGVVP